MSALYPMNSKIFTEDTKRWKVVISQHQLTTIRADVKHLFPAIRETSEMITERSKPHRSSFNLIIDGTPKGRE